VIPVALPTPVVGSSSAQLGQAGAVSLPDAGVTATWQPGAVPVNGTVTLAPTPSRLAVTGSAIALGIDAAFPLPWPIDVQYASAAPDAVPGFIPTTGAWQPVSELASPALPEGQSSGAYRDAGGALHILTRSPGRFALFAPGKWGDPRFISSHAPQLALVTDVTVTHRPDGAAVVRGRFTLDTQAHLYVSVLAPGGQALVTQQGSRVGWWLKGLPTKTIQTLQLRPGEFPVRLVVPARQVSAAGRYALRLAALDPYGRTVRLVVRVPQLGATG
jgi:hypothetical protein